VLKEMLSELPAAAANPALLVGYETGDDAAVYKVNDEQGVVATTDFFMPIVDDPFDFGRISATNALSDVYAVGGKPIMALAIAGFPVNDMTQDQIQQVLAGGAAACAAAGVPIAGGHTIDAKEPIYGLAVVGLVHPDKIKRNSDAQDGDVLILGKGLGVGILGAAMNKDELSPEGYKEMVDSTTKLNAIGADLAEMPSVNALTDVTGFGLGGHLFELCDGAGLTATLDWDKLPILPLALGYAQKGYNTGAANRNWASFGDNVSVADDMEQWQRNLIMDPQTSGGLMVSCKPDDAAEIVALFHAQGFPHAAVIGEMKTGVPHVTVRG
jgi:selenide,water dikinase